jgi:hypothetical protein
VERHVPALLILPALPVTFLAGPAGLLLYFAVPLRPCPAGQDGGFRMNTLAATLPFSRSGKGLIAELIERQRTLTLYAALMLALAGVTTLLQLADPRLLGGVSVWVKPTKFLVSTAVVRADQRMVLRPGPPRAAARAGHAPAGRAVDHIGELRDRLDHVAGGAGPPLPLQHRQRARQRHVRPDGPVRRAADRHGADAGLGDCASSGARLRKRLPHRRDPWGWCSPSSWA